MTAVEGASKLILVTGMACTFFSVSPVFSKDENRPHQDFLD